MRSSRSLVISLFKPWPRSLVSPFHSAPIHTSCPACAAKARPKTDEYGLPVRRPLPKLTRFGATIPTSSASSPLKRKTRTTEQVEPLSLLSEQDESPSQEPTNESVKVDLTQVMTRLEETIRLNHAKYPDAILLTQVGSFFESYFEQAPMVAKLLGIKLTSKKFGKKNDKVRYAFAGFPLAQLAKHASTLVEQGHKVVIVEEVNEVGNGSTSDGSKTRRVTRVITPGTGVDEAFVKLDQIAYVLAIGFDSNRSGEGQKIGMAYKDISIGSSFTRTTTLDSLRDDLLLVRPKEIVVDTAISSTPFGQAVLSILEAEQRRESIMLSSISTSAISPSSKSTNDIESKAENVLLAYLAETLVSTPPPPIDPIHFDPSKTLQMDSVTLKSLEVRESLRGGSKGSLFHAVKRTSTPSGARLLLERLCTPSTELELINDRLSLVANFVKVASSRRHVMAILKTFDDLPRLLQKFYLRRSSAFDLLALKKIIIGVKEIRAILSYHLDTPGELEATDRASLEALMDRLQDHSNLAEAIELAIDEEALHERHERALQKQELIESYGSSISDKVMEEEFDEDPKEESEGLWGKDEPWAIRPDFSPALQTLHDRLITLRKSADEMRLKMMETYTVKNATFRVAPKFGPIVHISSSKATNLDDPVHSGFSLLSKSGSTRSYAFSQWTSLHAKILRATGNIQKLETEVTRVLVTRVLEKFEGLHVLSQAIAELDVALSSAELATEMDWIRPELDESTSLTIRDGRHPTVEQALQAQSRVFTTNSVHFDHPSTFVHVITGPNMAGKSTFLRQTALIVILAQSGSFVPCTSAKIGIVDRIFSRVGARDELDRDRSTFMIEMDEAASILHNATERSLVLFDELGRGTSPLDGLAIAYAALEHLVKINKSRTLFATHYHRLAELLGYDEDEATGDGNVAADWDGVEFWCTDLDEQEDSVAYLHQVKRGLNDDSGGLTVARLSGMPERAIRTATEMRERYRN